MALESVSDRLRELAESDSGLRRSRAMAQLWAEIRRASPEERRVFGHALADRFAPPLAERFETITGIEGPEFIELVRNLIDLEADDIRGVISDLADLADDPAGMTDEVAVGESAEAAGRDEFVDEIFDRLSGGQTGEDQVSDAAERLLDGDGVDSDALAQAVEALDELPGAGAAPTAFEEAQERLRRLAESDETAQEPPAADPRAETGEESSASMPTDRVEHPPAVVWEPPAPHDEAETAGDLADRLQATPDGWRRRRMLSSAIRRDEVGVRTALELSDLLSSRIDRAWIAGDLIERGLNAEERSLVRSRGLPPHLARRLERTP